MLGTHSQNSCVCLRSVLFFHLPVCSYWLPCSSTGTSKSHKGAMFAKSLQSCLTLCAAPEGSSVLGILQARILEGVVPSFSRGYIPDPGIKPPSLMSPALAGRSFTTSATWEHVKVPYGLRAKWENILPGNCEFLNTSICVESQENSHSCIKIWTLIMRPDPTPHRIGSTNCNRNHSLPQI